MMQIFATFAIYRCNFLLQLIAAYNLARISSLSSESPNHWRLSNWNKCSSFLNAIFFISLWNKIYRVVHKIAQSLMHIHFATICSRIVQVFTKMLRKDHCLPVSVKYYRFVKYSLINSRNWIYPGMWTWHSDNWRSTANRDFVIDKGWIIEKMIIEFPAGRWKWHILFDLLKIIESTGFAKRLNNRRRFRYQDD